MSEEHKSITVGRYLLHRQIARGGMATIHIARLMGDEGFSRIVAAKRLLPELAEDTDFVAMFMDEARIASKVHHPNVVPVLDLVTTTDEVMLVQEYVHGVPLHVLLRTAHEASKKIPVRIAVAIATQVLAGLHAAHTTLDELGQPLHIIHRDVSPQNVMIALDGSARLLDFGVAKTTIAAHVTRDGTFKGKLAYSAPEQVRGKPVQQSDIYSLAVVLWELLVGHRMHGSAQGEAELVATILDGRLQTITDALSNEADWGAINSDEWRMLNEIDPIISRGLAVDAAARYQTAADMADALVSCVTPATAGEVSTWVKTLGKDFIDGRDKIIAAEEASWRKKGHALQGVRRHTLPGVDKDLGSQPSQPSHPSQPSVASQPSQVSLGSLAPMPAAPNNRGPKLVVGALGVLVVLLGVGVLWGVKGGDASPRQEPPPHVSAKPVEQSIPLAPVAATAPAPAVAATAPAPSAPESVDSPATSEASEPDEAPPQMAPDDEPVVAKKPLRRIKPRAAPTPALPAPIAQPTPAPVPQAAPAPAVDCTTPYYFEGQKKVFKPQCL